LSIADLPEHGNARAGIARWWIDELDRLFTTLLIVNFDTSKSQVPI
jgi:hypothetical protein